MKKFLLISLFAINCNGMADSVCGAIEGESPNKTIERMNLECMAHKRECPFKCKSYYAHMMIESIKTLVEDLYHQNLIDIETMEREFNSLRNERNAEMMDQVLAKIKQLKEETNS